MIDFGVDFDRDSGGVRLIDRRQLTKPGCTVHINLISAPLPAAAAGSALGVMVRLVILTGQRSSLRRVPAVSLPIQSATDEYSLFVGVGVWSLKKSLGKIDCNKLGHPRGRNTQNENEVHLLLHVSGLQCRGCGRRLCGGR